MYRDVVSMNHWSCGKGRQGRSKLKVPHVLEDPEILTTDQDYLI